MHASQLPTGAASRPFGHVPGMPSPFPPQPQGQAGYASSTSAPPPHLQQQQQQQLQQPQSAAQAYAAAVPASSSGSTAQQRQSERALLATASSMAQRSYNEGNFAMAKRLLDSVSVSYRHEGWKSILTAALLTALDCAVRLGHVHDAVQYSLELMGHSLLVTHAQKALIMQQLMSLVAAPPAAVAPMLPAGGDASSSTAVVASAAAPSAFDVKAHVFEVDRRHGILAATSHFLTVPSSSSLSLTAAAASSLATDGVLSAVSTSRDPFVCVTEEFDLVLSLAVAFPQSAEFGRVDVYFYAPPPPPPPHVHGTNAAPAPAANATPYHLVLLPGGSAMPVHDLRGVSGSDIGSGAAPSDRDLPVLRPDALGHVRADLSFPGVQLHGVGAGAAAGSGNGAAVGPHKGGAAASHHGGSTVFTFGPPITGPVVRGSSIGGSASSSDASSLRSTPAARTFRIRMRATQATTTSSATLNLPLAPASAAAAAAGAASAAQSQALHIPGANQALFVTTVVASLTVPPPPPPPASAAAASSSAASALQLKIDVLPSKPDESFVPSVLLEQMAAERKEREKKAKKKGLPLPPPSSMFDVSLDTPARTPTLRILPQHARAHLSLLHPGPALLGEFYPLQVLVHSDGDQIKQGELVLQAASGSLTSSAGSGAPGASPSPTSSPNPSSSLTSSSSTEGLAAIKAATTAAAAGDEDVASRSSPSPSLVGDPSAAAAAAQEPLVKFYRLTSLGTKVVGRPSSSAHVSGEGLFEELAAGEALPVPELAAGGSHVLVVFLRCMPPSTAAASSISAPSSYTPTISLTLTYTNEHGTALGVTSALSGGGNSGSSGGGSTAISTAAGGVASLPSQPQQAQALTFRAPFKIKAKIFSDALSGLAPPPAVPAAGAGGAAGSPPNALSSSSAAAVASATQAQRLILHQPVLLHLELENVSGCVLRLDELGLDLSTKFFRNTSRLLPGSNMLAKLRACVSPAADDALVEASRRASSSSSSSSSDDADDAAHMATPAVALASGEKYTHLFSFVPTVPGKTRFTPLHIRWNRVANCVEHPPLPPPPVPMQMTVLEEKEEKDYGSDSSLKDSAAPSSAVAVQRTPRAPPTSLLFPTCSVTFRRDVLSFQILKAPLIVTLDFPPSVTLGDTFSYVLRIANATEQMHDVELALLEAGAKAPTAAAGGGGAADGSAQAAGATRAGATAASASAPASSSAASSALVKCVLSGRTRGLLRVRPHSTCTVAYRVCPLECGALSLPRIQLTAAGLTTLSHAVTGGGAAPSPAAAASVLLMDPNDVGIVFVHPRAKQTSGGHAAAAEEETTQQPPPPLPPRLLQR